MSRSRRPLPSGEASDYPLQACEGIAEAHPRAVVHRRLRPKNLFPARRPDGTPLLKVLDLGLLKMITNNEVVKDASLTTPGLIMGSVHPTSPEQVRSLKCAGGRTDIRALGVILYRLLTGKHPLQGQGIQFAAASILVDASRPL